MKNRALTSVYVSYRRERASKVVVDRLKQACAARRIALTLDEKAIGYRDSIREFMSRLGAGRCVIVVLSESYLKSKNCMFELLEIERHKELRQRVFPVVLRGTQIHDAEDRLELVDYWDEKIRTLEAQGVS